MNEFNNRIAVQRNVLRLVNSKHWGKEELCGLSKKAIERWISLNRIDPTSHLLSLIRIVSEKLFFLANKSQDQVSEEYNLMSQEIIKITKMIEIELVQYFQNR